ncbi:MAG: M28 family peptidase [bacterium]
MMKNKSGLVMVTGFFVISFALTGYHTNHLSATAPTAKNGNAKAITAAQLRNHLTFIASDELEGRNTGSRGLKTAAKYIAAHLERWGVKPAGDDRTYFQKIVLRKSTIDLAGTSVEINGQRFSFGADFLAQPNTASASGKVVYAGHGWVIKSKGINAYDSVDVKDKIVIVSEGLPEGVSFRELRRSRGDDVIRPSQYARANGAKGLITVPGFRTLTRWERSRKRALERGSIVVEKFQSQSNEGLPSITASASLVAALFSGEQHNGTAILRAATGGDEIAPFDLNPGKIVSITVAANITQEVTQNVVGEIEGKDGKLKNEFVAIGAHYDHVGVGRPVAGDAIYNGADDDGSGTVAVLAIAEAFATGSRPKRSILLVWHTGEERGLWGSRYFNEYPTVPHEQIITQLNIDMIGRSRPDGDTNPANRNLAGPKEVYVIGSKMMSTELGEISEKVNNSFLKLNFNYKYDDPNDPQRFFFRSDHYNYARKGIPIIFYFTGVHQDYHRPSDHVEKIDFQKMEMIARTIYATGWELANRSKRPVVDKELPSRLTRR